MDMTSNVPLWPISQEFNSSISKLVCPIAITRAVFRKVFKWWMKLRFRRWDNTLTLSVEGGRVLSLA